MFRNPPQPQPWSGAGAGVGVDEHQADVAPRSRIGDLVVDEHQVCGKDELVTRRGIVVDVVGTKAIVGWFAECTPVPLEQL